MIIRDAAVAADYVASLASHHQPEATRPWDEVTEDVRQQVQAVIDRTGAFTTSGDRAAFLCHQHGPPAVSGRCRRPLGNLP